MVCAGAAGGQTGLIAPSLCDTLMFFVLRIEVMPRVGLRPLSDPPPPAPPPEIGFEDDPDPGCPAPVIGPVFDPQAVMIKARDKRPVWSLRQEVKRKAFRIFLARFKIREEYKGYCL